MEDIENLVIELVEAADAYYQGTAPTMTDDDYDAKIAYLRTVVPNTEYSSDERVIKLLEGDVAGGSKPTGSLVRHTEPMLSLGKANSVDDIKDYLSSISTAGATGVRLQAKLDGYAISALYSEGKLVQLSTRGDGSMGQDMSFLINNPEITIKGLPSRLKSTRDLELRGELFMTDSQFESASNKRAELTGKPFKNSRNAVVGITKSAEQGVGYSVELTFSVYTLLIDNKYQEFNLLNNETDLIIINALSFKEYSNHGGSGDLVSSLDLSNVMDKINEFGTTRESFSIPTDGVVLKPLNEAIFYKKMGAVEHHPLAFIAFKYPAETKNTKIREFVINVGKTGRVAPKAIIDPIEVGGATITRASCHNFNWIYEHNLRVGSVVSVGRGNDVIPKIMNVVIPGDNPLPTVPTNCPECGTLLKVGNEDEDVYPPRTLECPNDQCPSRLFNLLKSAVGKQGLDIDGLNNVSLSALVDSGLVRDIDDLFALTVDKIKNIVIGQTPSGRDRKLGDKRASNLVEAINKARTDTPAYKMLNSLGFLSVGTATAKRLLEHGNIKEVIQFDRGQLEQVEGFGETRIENFMGQQSRAQDLYSRLLARGVIMNEPERVVKSGQSFSISGIVPDGFDNRSDFVAYMESNGWTYHKTPNKNTSVMFGNSESSSSKIVKAKKLGINIIKNLEELG